MIVAIIDYQWFSWWFISLVITAKLNSFNAILMSLLLSHQVIPEGVASRTQRLRIGDRILKVNGRDVSKATHQDAVQVGHFTSKYLFIYLFI